MSGKESTISVVVRVRPFTASEQQYLQQVPTESVFLGDGNLTGAPAEATVHHRAGTGKLIRKVVNVVDDRMLIFDPPENNPMAKMQQSVLNGSSNRGQQQQAPRIREHRFVFDRLFDEDATQNDIFCQTSRPLIDNVLDGYNSTVFAYGATGCGKTHTISGTPDHPGIIFLTMKELFERIETLKDTKTVELSLSYLEIYNETIRDLMDPTPAGEKRAPLMLRENANEHISVSNLSSHHPNHVDDVMDMILRGNHNRTMSPTEANAVSSRSHAVLQINVTQKSRTAELSEAHTFATLSIIDLAGSERASATKNRGERLIEGANINKSLLSLGNCINALCDPRQRGHVPYRDSKLTRLLKFSLGGNCKTVMIVCISPSSQHYDETLNTLKYADRAKKIKTKVTRNQHNVDRHVGSYLKMITEQRAEIEELRNREGKVVADALAKFKRAKDECQTAFKAAVAELDEGLAQAGSDWVRRRVQCLNGIRLIEVQVPQYNVIIEALASLTSATEATNNLAASLGQARDSLTQEQANLRQFVSNNNCPVSQMAAPLARRLQQTVGWSQDDYDSFKTYVDLKHEQLEAEVLRQVAGYNVASTGALQTISTLMVTTLQRLEQLRHSASPELFAGEVVLLCQELFGELENNLKSSLQATGDVDVSFASTLSATPTPVLSPIRKSRRISILKRRSPHVVRRVSFTSSPARQRKASKKVHWGDGDKPEAEPPLAEESDEMTPIEVPMDDSHEGASHDDSETFDNSMTEDGTLQELSMDDLNMSSLDFKADSAPRKPTSKFGVRGDLKRRSTGGRGPHHGSVLGVSRPARIEKESSSSPITADRTAQLSSAVAAAEETTTFTRAVPFHMAATASSSRKLIRK